jgi:HAD domain in Swiss Army Knife RNA repair proteins
VKVLFLDMDGVINSDRFMRRTHVRRSLVPKFSEAAFLAMIDPDAVALVNEIVDRTGCAVVSSSAWRTIWNPERLTKMLRAQGGTFTVSSKTPVTPESRGRQIASWLERHTGVESAAILDYNDDMGSLRPLLVRTTHERGIEPVHVERAVALLSRRPGRTALG